MRRMEGIVTFTSGPYKGRQGTIKGEPYSGEFEVLLDDNETVTMCTIAEIHKYCE